MIEAFYGASFLGVGILIDQLGTYIGALNAWHCRRRNVLVEPSRHPLCFKRDRGKVIKFAPFQALLLALILRPFEFPGDFEQMLTRLGATLAPLAFVSVGYQLRLGDLKGRIPALTLGRCSSLLLGRF